MEPQSHTSDQFSQGLVTIASSLARDQQSLRSINLVTNQQTVVFNGNTYTFDGEKKNKDLKLLSSRYLPLEQQNYLSGLLPDSTKNTLSGLVKIHVNITKDLSKTETCLLALSDDTLCSSEVIDILTHLILLKSELKEALKDQKGIVLIIRIANPEEKYEEIATKIVLKFKETYKKIKAIIANYADLRRKALNESKEKEEEFTPFPVNPLSFCLASEAFVPLTPLNGFEPSTDEDETNGFEPSLALSYEQNSSSNSHAKLVPAALENSVAQFVDPLAHIFEIFAGSRLLDNASQSLSPPQPNIDIADNSALLTTEQQKELNQAILEQLAAIRKKLSLRLNFQETVDAFSEKFEVTLNKLPLDFKQKTNDLLEEFELTLQNPHELYPSQEALEDQQLLLNLQLQRILFGLNEFESLPQHLKERLKRESQRVLCAFNPDSFPREALSEDINKNVKEALISLEDASLGSWVVGKDKKGRRVCFVKNSETAFSTFYI